MAWRFEPLYLDRTWTSTTLQLNYLFLFFLVRGSSISGTVVNEKIHLIALILSQSVFASQVSNLKMMVVFGYRVKVDLWRRSWIVGALISRLHLVAYKSLSVQDQEILDNILVCLEPGVSEGLLSGRSPGWIHGKH